MRYILPASSDPGSEYREEVKVPGRQDFNPVRRSAYLVWWHCSHFFNSLFRAITMPYSHLYNLLQAHVAPGYTAGSAPVDPALLEREAMAEARGIATSVLQVLGTRGVAVSDAQQQEILTCRDLDRLRRWLDLALLNSSAEDLTSAS